MAIIDESMKQKANTNNTVKKRKKKRISKHILESQKVKESDTSKIGLSTIEIESGENSKVKNKEQKKKKNIKEKDPQEAAAYLEAWKSHAGDSSITWKFNKNDQSWLIRHMFRSDRLNKAVFTLMIEYLANAADGTKVRVRELAKRRALRYKEWEKSTSNDNVESTTEKNDAMDNSDNTNKRDGNDESDEQQLWSNLNFHEKRKEYKRARKILDEVKIANETTVSISSD